MILPMTLTMAAASTLLNLWLGLRARQMRVAHKVSIGDGGVEPLIARMRAQANFVEWAPFFLILLGGIEMVHGQPVWLWAVAALFIVARLLHAFGMDRPSGNLLRRAGICLTIAVMLVLVVTALIAVYRDRIDRMRPSAHINYVAAADQARAST